MPKFNIEVLLQNDLSDPSENKIDNDWRRSRLGELIQEARDNHVITRNGPIEMIDLDRWEEIGDKIKKEVGQRVNSKRKA